MNIDFADAYLIVMGLNLLYLVALLYGGMWYTNQQTVKCPQCGVRYKKYSLEDHECHPELVNDERQRIFP